MSIASDQEREVTKLVDRMDKRQVLNLLAMIEGRHSMAIGVITMDDVASYIGVTVYDLPESFINDCLNSKVWKSLSTTMFQVAEEIVPDVITEAVEKGRQHIKEIEALMDEIGEHVA